MSLKLTVYSRIAPIIAAFFALPLFAPPCWSTPGDADPTMVTDIVVGHNNKGPYSLSWTQIDRDSVRVVINGRTLKRGGDYNIDVAKGVVGFSSVLLNDAIVRVSYRTVPGKSKRAAGRLNVPITLDLLSRPDSNVKLTGLYAQDDPKNPDAGKTVIGVGGDKKWANSSLSSQFLVSQRSNSDRTANEPDLWRRSAFKFGGDTTAGALKLSGSYLHSGKEFGGAKEYATGLGKNVTDLDAVFAPSEVFQAAAKFHESEHTAGKTKGAHSQLSEQSLVYSPGASTRLSLIHSSTESRRAAAGSEEAVDSNLVRLDQSFGSNTAVVATFEDATVAAGGETDEVQTREMQLTSTPLHNVSLRGGMRQRYSELYGT